jgi:hypothetical protein
MFVVQPICGSQQPFGQVVALQSTHFPLTQVCVAPQLGPQTCWIPPHANEFMVSTETQLMS